jgi:fructokinase
MTVGSAAVTIVTSTDTCAMPMIDTPVVDTIGAGDTFTGAFLTWWMTGGQAGREPRRRRCPASAVDGASKTGERGGFAVRPAIAGPWETTCRRVDQWR